MKQRARAQPFPFVYVGDAFINRRARALTLFLRRDCRAERPELIQRLFPLLRTRREAEAAYERGRHGISDEARSEDAEHRRRDDERARARDAERLEPIGP